MMYGSSIWIKLVYLIGALLVLTFGGLTFYGPDAVSEVVPGVSAYVPEDYRVAGVLVGVGAFLLFVVFWARARSLVGLLGVSVLMGAAFWFAVNSDQNVFFRALYWCGGFVGVFLFFVYLIAFCRGRDVG